MRRNNLLSVRSCGIQIAVTETTERSLFMASFGAEESFFLFSFFYCSLLNVAERKIKAVSQNVFTVVCEQLEPIHFKIRLFQR